MKSTATLSPLENRVGCIAAAAAILGQKWTALIVRDIHASAKGFCELERTVEGINPRTLSQRLDELEKQEIITKEVCAGAPNRCEYRLTKKGLDLIPILKQMAEWGDKYPATALHA